MNSQNKKRLQIVLLILIGVLSLGIGYASISAINLVINGNATASVNQDNFKVYFVPTADTPNLIGNVTVTGTASIDSNDNTIATFNVGGLTKEGDYAIATYTILNNSETIGAELSLIVTNSNPDYFKVTETVTDTQLQAGDTTTGTVKVEMIKTPIDSDVSTSVTARLTASPLENAQAIGNDTASAEPIPDPESFSTDSWKTIQTAVKNNNTSIYNVGDTKEVTINNTDYTVRLVNKTTGEHCGDNDTAYSQTACGFVVEFVDQIAIMKMQNSATNVGGYPATLVYDYLQNTLYGQLPADLQSSIKPTRVISGYGCLSDNSPCTKPDNNGNNFSSTDNLYLLSRLELIGIDYGTDTAANTTTQLEYYIGQPTGSMYGSTTYLKTIKNPDYLYWLRSIPSSSKKMFNAMEHGMASNFDADIIASGGVYPAFRIG